MDTRDVVRARIQAKLTARRDEENEARRRSREADEFQGAMLIRIANRHLLDDTWDRGPGLKRAPEILVGACWDIPEREPYTSSGALYIVYDELNKAGYVCRVEWNPKSIDREGRLYLADPLRDSR